MVEYKSWKEFQDSGMLWWINMILHTFGWAIVIKTNCDEINVYPTRVKFRGFNEDTNTKGYQKVSKYLLENIPQIEEESRM